MNMKRFVASADSETDENIMGDSVSCYRKAL